VIPFLRGKKPLNGSDGHFGLEGDGLAVFPWEMGNKAGDIDSEVISGILVGCTVSESSEQSLQIGSDIGVFGRVHFGILREGKFRTGRILQHFTTQGKANTLRCSIKTLFWSCSRAFQGI